jgi:hypothetical protein
MVKPGSGLEFIGKLFVSHLLALLDRKVFKALLEQLDLKVQQVHKVFKALLDQFQM